MVITSCTSSHTCALSIAYNAQIPLCDSSIPDSQACRDPEALCVSDPSFAFDLSSSSNGAMTTIPLSALLPGHELVTSSSAYRGAYPVAPQIGDYNIDGYPDLLVVAQKGRDRLAYVLQSRPCEKGACSAKEIEMRRRAFRVVSVGADALGKIKDVESASWFDIADDVRGAPPTPARGLQSGVLIRKVTPCRARWTSSFSDWATRAQRARPSSSRTTTSTTRSS